jgi:hypothetical protein
MAGFYMHAQYNTVQRIRECHDRMLSRYSMGYTRIPTTAACNPIQFNSQDNLNTVAQALLHGVYINTQLTQALLNWHLQTRIRNRLYIYSPKFSEPIAIRIAIRTIF